MKKLLAIFLTLPLLAQTLPDPKTPNDATADYLYDAAVLWNTNIFDLWQPLFVTGVTNIATTVRVGTNGWSLPTTNIPPTDWGALVQSNGLFSFMKVTGPTGPQGIQGNAGAAGADGVSATNAFRLANVVDYGADPTGVAHSSLAFIAALNASSNTFGRPGIYIPAGTYTLDTTNTSSRDLGGGSRAMYEVPANGISVIGEARGSTFLQWTPTNLANGGVIKSLLFWSSGKTVSNAEFRQLTFKSSATNGEWLVAGGAEGATYNDAINLTAGGTTVLRNITIEDCEFLNLYGAGGWINSNVANDGSKANVSILNTRAEYCCNAPFNVNVDGLLFANNVVVRNYEATDLAVSRSIIIGNLFSENRNGVSMGGYWAARPNMWEGSGNLFANNIIEMTFTNYALVVADNLIDTSIIGNQIRNNLNGGVFIWSRAGDGGAPIGVTNVFVSNNRISNNGGDLYAQGISITGDDGVGVDGVTIANNEIVNSQYWLYNGQWGYFPPNQAYGIYTVGSVVGLRIVNNTIRGHSNTDIRLEHDGTNNVYFAGERLADAKFVGQDKVNTYSHTSLGLTQEGPTVWAGVTNITAAIGSIRTDPVTGTNNYIFTDRGWLKITLE